MKQIYLKFSMLLLCMVVGMSAWAQEVTLDFTTNDWKLPTSALKAEEGTYTNANGYSVSIYGDATNGFKYTSGYLIAGKKGAYVKLPKMSFEVSKIVVVGRSGASASVGYNIFCGDDAVSTAKAGATGTSEFEIAKDYQSVGTEYTLKVTTAHNIQITKIEFYKVGGEGPKVVDVTDVSLDKTSAELSLGEKLTLTATISPENATVKDVTWSSSNEEVATVVGGVVTAVSEGEATITVKTVSGEKTATCKVTVSAPKSTGNVYTKVTSNLKNWAGKYLLVYEDESVALDGSLNSGIDKTFNTKNVTISNDKIYGTEFIDDAIVEFEAVIGGYVLKTQDGTSIGISSYGNGLKTSTSTDYVNNIAYNSAESRIEITQTFTGGTMFLCFNSNSSDKRFRYYKEHSQKNIQLYKLEEDAPTSYSLTISPAEYATFYDSKNAYVMPEDCEGYVFTVENGLELAYEAGDAVPAGEPLVIYTIEPGTKELVYTTSAEETYKSGDMNDLEGTDTETAIAADANSYFYALTLDNNKENVGFYWMNATGAAFTNGAHKAYLKAAKTATSAKNFIFGETTAIKTIATATDTKIYDLTGREVKSPKAGIYVVNGVKKYIK